MTDEQTCRKISESLEPKPNWYPGDQTQMPQSKAWYFDFPGTGKWKPLRWFADPAARDLLVRKMLENGWMILTMYMNPNGIAHLEISHDSAGMNSIELATTYDRIWPLAYLKTLPDAEGE